MTLPVDFIAQNTVYGTTKAGTLKGLLGNDAIFGGAGNENIFGYAGNDFLYDGNGIDRITGGLGNDIFAFGLDGKKDYIKDFTLGQDRIDLSEWGVTSLSDFTMTALKNGQLQITFGTEILYVAGFKTRLAVTSLDADDFILADGGEEIVIDFDDITTYDSTGHAKINSHDPAYAGFTWSENFGIFNAATTTNIHTMGDKAPSGANVACNFYEQDVSLSRSEAFDFERATFGAVNLDTLNLRITAVKDGVVVGSQVVALTDSAPTTVDLDDTLFDSVTEVRFSTTEAGLNTATYNTHFYVDDMHFLI